MLEDDPGLMARPTHAILWKCQGTETSNVSLRPLNTDTLPAQARLATRFREPYFSREIRGRARRWTAASTERKRVSVIADGRAVRDFFESGTHDFTRHWKCFALRGVISQVRSTEHHRESAPRSIMAAVAIRTMQHVALKGDHVAGLDVPAQNIEAVAMAVDIRHGWKLGIAHTVGTVLVGGADNCRVVGLLS